MKILLPHLNRNKNRFASVGFSLIELISVMAILVLIVAFAVPSMNTVLRGSQLTQSAQLISSQLDLARQTALTRNHSVEVRFYQYGDPQVPGEQANDPGKGNFRAMQIFDIQESGSAIPLTKVQVVPPSIIIDSGATLSSIIGSATGSVVPTTAPAATLNFPLPRVGNQYNCVLFRYLPNGSTNMNLPSTTGCFLTLHNLNDGGALATPPKNFFTIQIDPNNGHIKTFRP